MDGKSDIWMIVGLLSLISLRVICLRSIVKGGTSGKIEHLDGFAG